MKKILIITLEYPPQVGGIATYVEQFAKALPEPANIVLYAPQMKDDTSWDSKQPYKVIRDEPLFLLWWPRWMRSYFQVKRIAKQEKIELILLHHVLPVGYIGWMMKKFHKIPYIVFSHGTDVLMGTATRWKRRMVRQISRMAEVIVFNSESLKHRFLRVLPEMEQKSLVLYPCPESSLFTSPSEEDILRLKSQYALEGKHVMLSIGRMEDGKGFTHIARMLPNMLKQNPHLVWLVIGDGPKMKDVVAFVQEHNLQNVVRFLGKMPHEDIRIYYYLADLFVLLTHPDEGKEEGLGLVFLEAAAAGLPVVAGKSGGVEEAVLHEQTGLVVDLYKGDKQVIDAITRLLEDPVFAKTLGEQAKERMMKDFQWEVQIGKLEPWLSGVRHKA